MRDPITVGGHLRIRPFNTAETYPEQRLDNDLCQAVVAGNTVYLRGQVPQDLDTGENVAIGDPAGQAGQVMANIATLLAEAGAGPEHIAKLTWYVTDKQAYLDALPQVGAAYRALMGRNYPAMAVVQVTALVEDGAMIEIEAMAVVPE